MTLDAGAYVCVCVCVCVCVYEFAAVIELSIVWGKMTKNSSQIFILSLLVVRMLLMKDPLDWCSGA